MSVISVRDRALSIPCLHCHAIPGEPCRYPTGQIAVTHRVRARTVVDGADGLLAKVCPECNAEPGMPCRSRKGDWAETHRRRMGDRPIRGQAVPRMRSMPSGVFSYKVTHFESRGSRTFAAVNVSVDGSPCKRVGIELAAHELSDRGIRAAITAKLAEETAEANPS